MCVCIHIYVHMTMDMDMYMCIHTHTRTHIHTHMRPYYPQCSATCFLNNRFFIFFKSYIKVYEKKHNLTSILMMDIYVVASFWLLQCGRGSQ